MIVLTGNWFKGVRYGHGHFRSHEKWTYEGEFDANTPNGKGMMDYADGSFYLGNWVSGKRSGTGLYISRMRDIYRGDFVDDSFHGLGEIVYSNGARYTGRFKNGLREGKGVLMNPSGGEHYGHFHADLFEGEFIVKNIIPIENIEQDAFEVRVALYEKGQFIQWKSKYTNPMATRQFVTLFQQNREMFDSVYSLIIAKHLPEFPTGLDPTNDDVQWIMDKLRREAGMLIGTEALHAAEADADHLLQPIRDCRADILRLKGELDVLNSQTINAENEKVMLMRQHLALAFVVENDMEKIEQYWIDEPTEVRGKFNKSCKELATVARDDFFLFKNHRTPPPFVKKILDCISILLGEPINKWVKQQMLVSDAPFNARMNDDEALRFDYECKLVHMMKTFDVFEHTHHTANQKHFFEVSSDPRFRVDSYYVESTGAAGPFLVDWVFKCRDYIKNAKMVDSMLNGAKEKRILASRLLTASNKHADDENHFIRCTLSTREAYDNRQKELIELNSALEKSQDMITFIKDSYNIGRKQRTKLDYYEILEEKIEADRKKFDISACVETLVQNVVELDREATHARAMLYKARGEEFVPPVLSAPNLKECIINEVNFNQKLLLDSGYTLGYGIEPLETDVPYEETYDICGQIATQLIYKANDCLNEFSSCLKWISLKGKVLKPTFFYRTVWKYWKEIAVKREEDDGITAWEKIWNDEDECARMCIQSRINSRMSTMAKEQGRIWQKRNAKKIEVMEQIMSEEFGVEYTVDTRAKAIDIAENDKNAYPPATKAGAICWIKYHPNLIAEEKDARGKIMAGDFQEQFKGNTAPMAFKIINQLIGNDSPDMKWIDHAEAWKSINSEKYDEEADKIVVLLKDKFAKKYPIKTAWEAVMAVEHELVSKYITVASVASEYSTNPEEYFGAKSYISKNVGMARAARELVQKDMYTQQKRSFDELAHTTELFIKGSYLLTEEAQKYDPTKDRFSGFRDRLEQKYALLYGYLLKRQQDIWDNMEDLKASNPMEHNWHNLRPTKADKIIRDAEDKYLKEKAGMEASYDEIFQMLNSWHTYFGSWDEKQWYKENSAPLEQRVASIDDATAALEGAIIAVEEGAPDTSGTSGTS